MTSSSPLISNGDALYGPPLENAWNDSLLKRLFDLLLALLLLFLFSPLMLAIALSVKSTSKGSVLFRQNRVGKHGHEFQLFKFRSMRQGCAGPKVTRTGDPRITAVGSIIRKWKLDELPQLFNVVRGDMSFVGPRPDVAEYLRRLNQAQRQILHLRPGITSSATLKYRKEEQLLSQVNDNVETFYCTEVLPEKVRMDLDYAQNAGFRSDLGILLRTLGAILS
jgi:lipopolysaccharide/colanic/teichoic acid biosynthesis glycosyltransferase